jgi:hypothetical protein
LSRGWRKGIRSLLQVAAGGGLTALVALIGKGFSPTTAVALTVIWGAIVATLHNFFESSGIIPVLLPTPALVPMAATIGAVIAPVAGTVEAVAEDTGHVVGSVKDLAGAVVGTVTGAVETIAGNDDEGIDKLIGGNET